MRITQAQLRQYFIPRLRSFFLIQQIILGTSAALFCRKLVQPFMQNENMKQIQTIPKSESLLCKPRGDGSIPEKMRNKFAAEPHVSCSPPLLRVSSIDMLTKLLQIGVIGLMLCAANAWAGPAGIQGIVKDAKGQPIKNADVRIESRDGKQLLNTTKTDAKGRYISQGLQPGVYRVSLVVNGAVKASIMNTQTKADRQTQLNFDLKAAAPSQASASAKSGKHMVWVPSSTGSHIGGSWVEVGADTGALNVKKGSAEALHRQQMQNSQGPQSFPGAVGNGTQP
jgi:hypothetical protein